MRENILEYKGYYAKVEFSAEDAVLYGKIEGINDLISFESESASGISQAFQEAVDDYLNFCQEVGKSPEKAYKGSFNIRIPPELHKSLARLALKQGKKLNEVVVQALEAWVSECSVEQKALFDKITTIADSLKYTNTGKARPDSIVSGVPFQMSNKYNTTHIQ